LNSNFDYPAPIVNIEETRSMPVKKKDEVKEEGKEY
jgi:hypothetical protein